VRRSMQAGFDHHLTKPVDFESLLAILGDCAPRASKTPA
jgi:CheY-like chemotaxis protein